MIIDSMTTAHTTILTIEVAIVSTVAENEDSAGMSTRVIEPMLVKVLQGKAK